MEGMEGRREEGEKRVGGRRGRKGKEGGVCTNQEWVARGPGTVLVSQKPEIDHKTDF